MFFKVMFVCAVVAMVTEGSNSCPEFAATTNLNLEKFAEGKWYLAAKTEKEEWNNCVFYETKVTPEKIRTKHFFNKKGDQISSDYPYEIDVEKGAISFPTMRYNNKMFNLSVITDYDHYNVNYCCKVKNDGSIEEYAALNVRADDLSNLDKAIENAKKRLAEAGSRITELFPSKRENCPQ